MCEGASDVSAVNSDPVKAAGDSSADQTLSNISTHTSFAPSGDFQLSDKSASGETLKKKAAVKLCH